MGAGVPFRRRISKPASSSGTPPAYRWYLPEITAHRGSFATNRAICARNSMAAIEPTGILKDRAGIVPKRGLARVRLEDRSDFASSRKTGSHEDTKARRNLLWNSFVSSCLRDSDLIGFQMS